MWSLGCIVVELFLGLPLFPGSSEYNQVSRITEMLGLPPMWMLEVGKQSGEFFEKTHDEYGRRSYRLKSMEQYSREHGSKEQPSKKYFQATTLPEIVRSYSMPRKNMKQSEIDRGRTSSNLDMIVPLTISRNEQPRSIHRFCSRTPKHQPAGALVTSTGQIAPLHHAAEIHSTVRASDESQVLYNLEVACTWCTAATASGSSQ